MRHIEDFNEGEKIIGHFLCKRKHYGETKAGKAYLMLTLADKTASIEAKVWDIGPDIEDFEQGDFIKVKGETQTYREQIQLIVYRLRKSLDSEYNIADYVPVTDKDIAGLTDGIGELTRTITNPFLLAVVEGIYARPDVSERFSRHSAGKVMHHAYAGGLAEHTLFVAQTCDFLSGRYLHIDRDLCIAGALLHDVGKIYEYSSFPQNEYTDDGNLLGHIYMTAKMIEEEIAKAPDFPPELRKLLIHMILSHHGEHEYGSPKLPVTIEAMVLHIADNTDAKLKSIETSLNERSRGQYTAKNWMLKRALRRKDDDNTGDMT